MNGTDVAAVATLAACLLVCLRGYRWAGKPYPTSDERYAMTHAEADRIALHLGEDWSALDVLDEDAHGRLDQLMAVAQQHRKTP